MLPFAVRKAALLEHELDRTVSKRFSIDAFIGFRSKVVPLIIDNDPAADQLAAGSIVVSAVNHLQSGHSGFQTAGLTDKLVTGDHVLVPRRGNGSAPFHNGVTDFAEGTAGVAVLDAGGCLVLDGSRIMDVRGAVLREVGGIHVVTGRVHLGRNAELLIGECASGAVNKGDTALVNIQLQIMAPEFMRRILPVLLGGLAGDMDVVVIVEDAYR